MKNFKNVLLTSLVVTLSGCASGVNFQKMPEEQLVLGKTTKQEIVVSMGKPNFKGTKTSNGVDIEIMTYAYAKVGGKSALPGVTAARSQGLFLKDGVLVGKEYTSSFAEDNTLFDVVKAKTITKGQKKSEVISLLGMTKGEYIYPVIESKTGNALVYLFTQTKGFKSKSDVLIVEFDTNNIVTDTKLISAGQL